MRRRQCATSRWTPLATRIAVPATVALLAVVLQLWSLHRHLPSRNKPIRSLTDLRQSRPTGPSPHSQIISAESKNAIVSAPEFTKQPGVNATPPAPKAAKASDLESRPSPKSPEPDETNMSSAEEMRKEYDARARVAAIAAPPPEAQGTEATPTASVVNSKDADVALQDFRDVLQRIKIAGRPVNDQFTTRVDGIIASNRPSLDPFVPEQFQRAIFL